MTNLPDLTPIVGKRYRDAQGMTWQLAIHHDPTIPYWFRVKRGLAGNTLYALIDGPRIALAMLRKLNP